MTRVLIIGHGAIGKVRAKGIVASGATLGATLAGTVDIVPRKPEMYGTVPHFADLAEVPVDSFDAAILAVPHHLAAPLGVRLLEAGKPVLVEKPLGMTETEAKALAEASRKVQRPSFVGYNYRYMPGIRAAFERARAGGLGRLRSIDMMLGHGGHPGPKDEWKLRRDLAGGGALLDPGVHLLDLALSLEPKLEVHGAHATSGFWGTGIEEDVVAILGRGPLQVIIRSSRIRWVNTFRVEIVGDDGYAVVDGRGGTYGPQVLRVGKRWGWNDGTGRGQRDTEESTNFGDASSSFDEELADVICAWRDGTIPSQSPHPCTFAEGLEVARVTSRLYESLHAAAGAS